MVKGENELYVSSLGRSLRFKFKKLPLEQSPVLEGAPRKSLGESEKERLPSLPYLEICWAISQQAYPDAATRMQNNERIIEST